MATDREQLMQSAQRYLERGQLSEALDQYKKLAMTDGNDARVLLKLGDLQAKSGATSDAVATYATAGELYLRQSSPLKAAAVLALTNELIVTEAPELLDRYAHLGPRLAEIYTGLGLINDALNAYAESARRRLAGHAYPEALDLFERMVALDPNNPWSRVQLGEGLYEMGKATDAITAFATAAKILENAGRKDDALRVLERIISLGGAVEHAKHAARLYLDNGDRQSVRRALTMLQVCFRADPADLDTLGLLTRSFRALGQAKKADQVQAEVERLIAKRMGVEPEGDLPQPLDPKDIKEISPVTPLPAGDSVAKPGIASLSSLEAQTAAEPPTAPAGGPSLPSSVASALARPVSKSANVSPASSIPSAMAGTSRNGTAANQPASEQRRSSPPPLPSRRGPSVPPPGAGGAPPSQAQSSLPAGVDTVEHGITSVGVAPEAAELSEDTIPDGMKADMTAGSASAAHGSAILPDALSQRTLAVEGAAPTERGSEPPSAASATSSVADADSSPTIEVHEETEVDADAWLANSEALGNEAAHDGAAPGADEPAPPCAVPSAPSSTSVASLFDLAFEQAFEAEMKPPTSSARGAPEAAPDAEPRSDSSAQQADTPGADAADGSDRSGSGPATRTSPHLETRASVAQDSENTASSSTGPDAKAAAGAELTAPTDALKATDDAAAISASADAAPAAAQPQADTETSSAQEPTESVPAEPVPPAEVAKDASVVERKPEAEVPRETPKWVKQTLSDADAFLALRMYPRAIESLEEGLESDASAVELRERLVETLVKSGKTADAAKQAFTLGQQYVERGQTSEAEAALTRATELDPALTGAERALKELKGPREKATGS